MENKIYKILLVHSIIYTAVVLYCLYIFDRFYGVEGYFLDGYGVLNWFIALPFVLFLSVMMKINVKNVSDIIVLFSIVFYAFPLLFLSTAKPLRMIFIFFVFSGFLIFYRFLTTKILLLKDNRIKEIDCTIFKISSMIISLMVLFLFAINFNPKFSISFVDSLYEVRSNFKGSFSGFKVYVFTLTQYFAMPILIYHFLVSRSKLLKLLVLLLILWFTCQVFFYSAMKSSLFLPVYIFSGYYIIKKNKFSSMHFILFVAVGFFVLLSVSNFLSGVASYFFDHTLRRFIISPSLNAFYFLDYLVSNDLLQTGIPDLGGVVSNYYYHSENGNATTGLLADSIGRFGILGALFFMVIFPLYFALINFLSKKLDLNLQFVFFGGYSYVLLNTSLLTAQITYGLFFMVGLFFLFFMKNRIFKKY